METWQFVLGLSALMATVIASSVTATWRLTAWLAAQREYAAGQLQNINNAVLTRIQIAEDTIDAKVDSIVQRFDGRTLEMERDLAQFKAYVERNFLSKETFNTVMQAQSSERNLLKAELMDRLNRIDEKLDGRRA